MILTVFCLRIPCWNLMMYVQVMSVIKTLIYVKSEIYVKDYI